MALRRLLLSLLLLARAATGGMAEPRVPSANLSNGLAFPLLGLGCSSNMRLRHVKSALEQGYRLLDTAQAFYWGYNETEVGLAMQLSGVPRAEIFLQSKVQPQDLGYAATKRAVALSLERLRTGYLDSMLVHKPRCWPAACAREPEGTWQDSWRALTELLEAGVVRAIGICDVDEELLESLLRQKQKPHVVQNWMDPFHQDVRVRERCRREGIRYQAYSTLGTQWRMQGWAENPVFASPAIQEIAAARGADVAQVTLSWAVSRGAAVIPASKQPARQRSNLESLALELSQDELAAIDALDGSLERQQQRRRWDLVDMQFRNRGAAPLAAYWLGPDGPRRQGDMAPGAAMSLSTYHGHRWRFQAGEDVVEELVVDAHKGSRQELSIGGGKGDL